MKKRGVFFSTDALIAITIIFLVILIFQKSSKLDYPERKNLQYDLMTTLSAIKIGEINNSYVHLLIAQGKISDLNKTILEQIGDFYASDLSLAKNLSIEMLNAIETNVNLGIWYGDDLLASKNYSAYENSKNIEVSRQIISGIKKGTQATGFVSKSWLKKITSKKTSLIYKGDLICGDWKNYSGVEYCGTTRTNVTYKFEIPKNATVSKAEWLVEPSWQNQPVTLYINNYQIFSGTIASFRSFNISNRTVIGNNTAKIASTWGGDDGASHIAIDYTTPETQTYQIQNRFDFNELITNSILYQEKGMILTDPIKTINVSLNISRQAKLEIRVADKIILVGAKNVTNNKTSFSDSEIKSALNASGISYSSLNNQYIFIIIKGGIGTSGQQTILGANSHVYVDYESKTEIPFGSIDITQEIKIANYSNQNQGTFYRDLTWKFFLPTKAIPIVADWQFGWLSTSAGTTTSQLVKANGLSLYQSPPQGFIQAFSRYGYTPKINSSVFRDGENQFELHFGPTYSVSTNASYGSLTYFIRSFVNYGDTKPKASGGSKTIQFEDNSTKIISVGNSSDIWDPQNDSIDDAVDRLLSQLDANNNSKMDLTITQEDFKIDSLDISGVPYLWSTEVQVRTWF